MSMTNEIFDYQKYRAGLSEDAGKAFDAAQQEAIAMTAVKLKENRSQIIHLVDLTEEHLTDQKLVDLSTEYVKMGTLNGKNREQLKTNVAEKAELINQFVSVNPQLTGIANAMGFQKFSADSLDEMLPTQEQLNLPARRISEAVEEKSTSWLSKIVFAIQGFINWLGDWLNGDKGENLGLMAHIDAVAAKSIAQTAGEKLTQDLQKDENSALRGALGSEGLNGLIEKVEQGVKDARSGKEAESPSILERVRATEALPSKMNPQEWTDQQAKAFEVKMDGLLSTTVQTKVNDFFDVKKNGDFWEKQITEVKSELSRFNPLNWPTLVMGNAQRASDAAKDAVGGNAGVKDIGNAVAKGVMSVMKAKDRETINELLSDPAKHSEALGKEIAHATFNTAEWNKIETSINASELDGDKKKVFIDQLRNHIEGETINLVKNNAPAIIKAREAEGLIVDVVDRLRGSQQPAALTQQAQAAPAVMDQAMLNGVSHLKGKYSFDYIDTAGSPSFNPGNIPGGVGGQYIG